MLKGQKAKMLIAKYRLIEKAKSKENRNFEQEACIYMASNFDKLEEYFTIDSRASMEITMNGSTYVPGGIQRNKIIAIFNIIGILYGIIDGRLRQLTSQIDFYYDMNDRMGLYLTQDDITELHTTKENVPKRLFSLVEQYSNDSWYDIISLDKFETCKQQIHENNGDNFLKNSFLEGYLYGLNRTCYVDTKKFVCEFDFLLNGLLDKIEKMNKDKQQVKELIK